MKAISLILLCYLLSLSDSLHIKYHLSPESYLSTLKSQQQGITNQLSALKSQLSQTQQNVQAETDTLKKIKILEQAILRQKSLLSGLSRSTISPLNDSAWVCQNYVGTSQTELGGLASNIITSTSKIDQAINQLSNSTSSSYFRQDSSAAVAAAQDLQKSIYSDGSQVTALTTTQQTNWLAPNWVTGNKTLPQVEQQTKQIEQTGGYILTCPLIAPYFDGRQCIGCPDNARYFNVQTKKCMNCDSFDAATRRCILNTPVVPVTPTVAYNGTNFGVALNRTVFDPNAPINTIISQTAQACPSDRPFYSNGLCINCFSPNTLYNYTSQMCTTCPLGTTFIPEKHLCVGPNQVYATNLPAASDRLILPDGTTVTDLQNQQQSMSTTQTVVACPSDKPFFNGQTCISCQPSEYFNVAMLSCQGCPSGTSYNVTAHKCIATTFYSNLTNRNWTSTNPQATKQTIITSSQTPGAIACPGATPFYDGSKCVGCPPNQYFSFDGLRCQACPLGTQFSANQHSCVQPQTGLYQTNVTTAPNLIYAGTSKGQWVTIYRQNQQQNPQIQDCPSDRPYFDGIRCTSCPPAYPYFNLRFKLCQVCDENSKFDPAVHQCLTASGDIISQYPNIQKMVASIFT